MNEPEITFPGQPAAASSSAEQAVREHTDKGLHLDQHAHEQPVQLNGTSPPAPLTPEEAATQFLTPDVMLPTVASHAYVQNFMGPNFKIEKLFAALQETVVQSKRGDLSNLEAMLVSQATALQAIFTSLALRAAPLKDMRQHELCLSLALKAQAQSRATIQALVDLKFPRNATFVKQANIANGPQQVNNATQPPPAPARKKNGHDTTN